MMDTFHFVEPSYSQEALTNAECSHLVRGYSRLFFQEQSLPSDLVRLCVSFYSIWFDLKIVFCDDKTGEIDTNNYQIKAILNETVNEIIEEIEDCMYRQAISNEYEKLCKLSEEELMKEPEISMFSQSEQAQAILEKLGKDAFVQRMKKRIMQIRFANTELMGDEFDKEAARWNGESRKNANPLVHVWQTFDQMKKYYPINTHKIKLGQELYENEDANRWVEVPDDAKHDDVENFDFLVIERCNVDDWVEGTGTWPREKSYDWYFDLRETLRVGDIVEVRDDWDKDFESVIIYIYPNDHETKSGQCVVHYIGWDHKWDEALDVYSWRINKRYTNCTGPHRKGSFNRRENDLMIQDFQHLSFRQDAEILETPNSDGNPWIYYSYNGFDQVNVDENSSLNQEGVGVDVDNTAGLETYGSEKYARNYKAKKLYPKKKKLRRKWRKYGAKSGDKRIENKMKKYKINYECLAY